MLAVVSRTTDCYNPKHASIDIFDLSSLCTALGSEEKPPNFRKSISCTNLLVAVWTPYRLESYCFNFQILCSLLRIFQRGTGNQFNRACRGQKLKGTRLYESQHYKFDPGDYHSGHGVKKEPLMDTSLALACH